MEPLLHPTLTEHGHWIGESAKAGAAAMRIRWRLIPLDPTHLNLNPPLRTLYDRTPDKESAQYYVVCVNNFQVPTGPKHVLKTWQQYPGGAAPVWVRDPSRRDWEVVLGLTNPESQERGFKALVTSDYDLFCVWPLQGVRRGAPPVAAAGGRIGSKPPSQLRDVTIWTRWQTRPSDFPIGRNNQHYRLGNISRLINFAKVALNSSLIAAGYKGGNLVHHSDEVGNPLAGGLAKPLRDCLPLFAVFPRYPTAIGIDFLGDFGIFCDTCTLFDYDVQLRPGWDREIPWIPTSPNRPR